MTRDDQFPAASLYHIGQLVWFVALHVTDAEVLDTPSWWKKKGTGIQRSFLERLQSQEIELWL